MASAGRCHLAAWSSSFFTTGKSPRCCLYL